jgi:hypothetical protein
VEGEEEVLSSSAQRHQPTSVQEIMGSTVINSSFSQNASTATTKGIGRVSLRLPHEQQLLEDNAIISTTTVQLPQQQQLPKQQQQKQQTISGTTTTQTSAQRHRLLVQGTIISDSLPKTNRRLYYYIRTSTEYHQKTSPNFSKDILYNYSNNMQGVEQIPYNITTRATINATSHDPSTLHPHGSSLGVLTILSWIIFCLLVRLFLSHLHHRRDTAYFPLRERHSTNHLQHLQQQGLLRQQQQQRHFHSMVARINQQRQLYGERPLSVESLRFILLSSPQNDFNGQDYDHLLQLVEENGDVPTFLSDMMGATEAEINRCPSRTLRNTKDISIYKSCSVCLEPYQIHDTIRTIPCFHSFHVGCIDPWLRQKASCPICKYSAIG